MVNVVFRHGDLLRNVFEGKILTYMFAGVPPPLGILYEVDSLGGLMGFLVALIFPLVNLASYGYMEWATRHNCRYYTIFLGSRLALTFIILYMERIVLPLVFVLLFLGG